MRLLRPLLPLLLAVPALAACSGSSSPQGFTAPDVSAFSPGACALVAQDVVALGRLAHDLRDVPAPDDAARTTLKDAQDRVDAAADSADATVKPALKDLVLQTGLVRLQADARALKPSVAEGMTRSYQAVVRTCTGKTPG